MARVLPGLLGSALIRGYMGPPPRAPHSASRSGQASLRPSAIAIWWICSRLVRDGLIFAIKQGMKRICFLISALVLFLAGSTSSYAQRVQDGSYRTIAYIKSDGTVQDGSYRTVAYIKSDGTVQDASYRTVGYIKSDGTVQTGSYRTIGYIKGDGTVQDGSYRTIGYVKGNGTVQDGSYRTIGYTDGVPYRWAAWFFFFR